MPNKFVVNCQGLSLPLPRRQAVECAIRDRAVELAGGIESLQDAFNQPDRRINPKNKFNLYFNQAAIEAVIELGLPAHCKDDLRPVPRWEHVKD